MVDNDHGMRDTVVRVIGLWAVESENDHRVIPVVWNLGPPLEGALPITDIEAKLRKLTSIDYDHRNWSWLLDLKIPPVPLVVPRVGALDKRQPAHKPEVST